MLMARTCWASPRVYHRRSRQCRRLLSLQGSRRVDHRLNPLPVPHVNPPCSRPVNPAAFLPECQALSLLSSLSLCLLRCLRQCRLCSPLVVPALFLLVSQVCSPSVDPPVLRLLCQAVSHLCSLTVLQVVDRVFSLLVSRQVNQLLSPVVDPVVNPVVGPPRCPLVGRAVFPVLSRLIVPPVSQHVNQVVDLRHCPPRSRLLSLRLIRWFGPQLLQLVVLLFSLQLSPKLSPLRSRQPNHLLGLVLCLLPSPLVVPPLSLPLCPLLPRPFPALCPALLLQKPGLMWEFSKLLISEIPSLL